MFSDTKTRTQSVLKIINKRSVKAGRILSRALDNKGEYSAAQILAAESIVRLWLPYDIGTQTKDDYRGV